MWAANLYQSMIPVTPAISLNRVQLVSLPGMHVPPEILGKTAYELLSSTALTELIRQHITKLQLDPELNDLALHLAFEQCFDSPNGLVRTMAETIGYRLGRNLGYVLLALKRGDSINQEARKEWDASYWAHWAQINNVWLGGGLMSGRLGIRIQKHAMSVLRRAGIKPYRIHISPYAGSLPLIGAARYAPAGVSGALVFDFGGTMIKRGIATYESGQLANIQRLEPLRSPWAWMPNPSKEQIIRLFADVVSLITATFQQVCDQQVAMSPTVLMSMAAYIENGHPMPGQSGTYAQMRHITRNLQAALERHLSYRMKTPVNVTLLHDGSAAAAVHAREQDTAVITMGTALGIGFAKPGQELRPIKNHFSLLYPPNTLR